MDAKLVKSLKRLEADIGSDVLLLHWLHRPPYAFDPDREAARALHRCASHSKHADSVVVMISGRGGLAAFADSGLRALRAVYDRVHVVVVSDVSGAATLLALGADSCSLMRLGALGAYDTGPIGAGPQRLSPRVFDDVPAMGGVDMSLEVGLQGRLAYHKYESRMARNLADRLLKDRHRDLLSRLSAHELGDCTALGVADLEADGFVLEANSLWDSIAPIAVSQFEIPDGLGQPFTASGIGDEVEFAPAADVTVAGIQSIRFETRFVVDTGRPHPDSGNFDGAWTK